MVLRSPRAPASLCKREHADPSTRARMAASGANRRVMRGIMLSAGRDGKNDAPCSGVQRDLLLLSGPPFKTGRSQSRMSFGARFGPLDAQLLAPSAPRLRRRYAPVLAPLASREEDPVP